MSPVLGRNEPQFKPPRATARTYTTALNLFTPSSLQLNRGTGRTRPVSNLVAELSAPRLFSLFLSFLFLALLGGATTNLFTTSGIKESAPHVPRMKRRLGRGVHASYSHLDHSDSMYPPAVHPEPFGIWRLRTTSTQPPSQFLSGHLNESFWRNGSNASFPIFPTIGLAEERLTASSSNHDDEDDQDHNGEHARISQFFTWVMIFGNICVCFGLPLYLMETNHIGMQHMTLCSGVHLGDPKVRHLFGFG